MGEFRTCKDYRQVSAAIVCRNQKWLQATKLWPFAISDDSSAGYIQPPLVNIPPRNFEYLRLEFIISAEFLINTNYFCAHIFHLNLESPPAVNSFGNDFHMSDHRQQQQPQEENPYQV